MRPPPPYLRRAYVDAILMPFQLGMPPKGPWFAIHDSGPLVSSCMVALSCAILIGDIYSQRAKLRRNPCPVARKDPFTLVGQRSEMMNNGRDERLVRFAHGLYAIKAPFYEFEIFEGKWGQS